MSSAPAKLTVAHVACLNEALRQGPLMIERWRKAVVDVLNQRYTSSLQNIEKKHLQAAMVALNKHKAALTKGFTAELTKKIVNHSKTKSKTATEERRDFEASMSFDDLELMGENQVQDTLDSARLMQTVAMESEAGLAAVSARLSTAQGFAQVNLDQNPLRPEIFSRALLKTVQRIPVDNAIRALWFSHGGVFMGQQVQALYLALNDMLIERGVAPAAYRVITNRNDKDLDQSNDASTTGASGTSSAIPSAFAPVDSVFSELPLVSFPELDDSLIPEEIDSSWRELTPDDRLRHVFAPGDDAFLLRKSGANLGSALQRHLSKTVHEDAVTTATQKNSDPSLAQELVTLTIEKMANDSRLLAPVRQVIVNMGPVFLRLAGTEPQLFSDKSHPALHFLETIADKSLAFSSEKTPGFVEFMQYLQKIATQLSHEKSINAQHFVKQLAVVEQNIAQHHAALSENVGRTAQAHLLAKQCTALASKISAEILERPDFVLGNRVIAEFLSGPWSEVLAKERLAVDADETGLHKAVFSLTLGELLWSLDPEKTTPHPKRLAKVSPSILERLHGGLLSIGYPVAEAKPFFDEVLALHQSVLDAGKKPVLEAPARDTAPFGKPTKSAFAGLFALGDSSYGIKSWLAARGAQSPDIDRDDPEPEKTRFEKTQPFVRSIASSKTQPDEQTQSPGSIELRVGAWVELMDGHEWLRAQLTWVSCYQTLFIFTSAGGRTHSMNEPLLQYYLLQGLVKVISQDYVSAASA